MLILFFLCFVLSYVNYFFFSLFLQGLVFFCVMCIFGCYFVLHISFLSCMHVVVFSFCRAHYDASVFLPTLWSLLFAVASFKILRYPHIFLQAVIFIVYIFFLTIFGIYTCCFVTSISYFCCHIFQHIYIFVTTYFVCYIFQHVFVTIYFCMSYFSTYFCYNIFLYVIFFNIFLLPRVFVCHFSTYFCCNIFLVICSSLV